jgi:molybdate transport system ATP-binding protein
VSDLVATIAVRRNPDFAVEVELTCPPGITCIMGPSGSGKTTILSAIAGLVPPDRGRVTLGDDVWFDRPGRAPRPTIDIPVHARRLAYVFQSLALFPHMTALRNVEYALADTPPDPRRKRAVALLRRVGVEHLAQRRPRTFSGGEAQRVALARALARSPKLVLLDEPFSSLDRELRAQLIDLVRELARELAVPIIHVTHSIAEARSLADQIIHLDKGQVVARGAPSDVLQNVTELD